MHLYKYSCPKCRYVIERGTGNDSGIGSPLYQCPKCWSPIVRTNLKEWDMLSTAGKCWHIFTCFNTIWVGLFAITAIVYHFAPSWGLSHPGVWAAAALLVSILVFVPSIYQGERQVIEASQKRMADPEYRESLRRAGLKVLPPNNALQRTEAGH